MTIIQGIASIGGVSITASEAQALATQLASINGLSQADRVIRIRAALGVQATPSTRLARERAGLPANLPGPPPPVRIHPPVPSGTVAGPPRFSTGGHPVSLQIRTAVTSTQVSPGIFGTIGRVLSGAGRGLLSGGPIGAISGALGGFAGPQPVGPPVSRPGGFTAPSFPGIVAGPTRFPQSVPQLPVVVGPRSFGLPIGPPVLLGGAGPAPAPTTTMGGCPQGFRPNKTSYWTNAGFVPEGSRCVRRRRRNSLNPRALSRAIGRIEGAKRASKRLGRITIRKKC